MESSSIIKRNSDILTRNIDGQSVIMDPLKGKVLALNEVGGFIWGMADGTHNIQEILDSVCREFNVGREEASVDLDEFMDVLKEKGLLSSE